MWKRVKKSYWYFISFGVLWLFWQLFIDELVELARQIIPNEGVIMYGITHPYIIMPSLFILVGIFLLYWYKRKPTENVKNCIDTGNEYANILRQIHERDLKLKDRAVKQYLSLFSEKDFSEFLELFAHAQKGYDDLYKSTEKDIGKEKLSKDRVKKHQQIDGLTDIVMSSEIVNKEWTLEEIVKISNLIDKFPGEQNPKYKGIRSLRKTDKKWNNLINKLNGIKIAYPNIFSDKELTTTVNDFPEWSFGGSSVLIFADLMNRFASGLLPTEYISSGAYDPYEKIENRISSLIRDIDNRIKILFGELEIVLHHVVSYNWMPTKTYDTLDRPSKVEAEATLSPRSSVKIDSLHLHVGRHRYEAKNLPISNLDTQGTYKISFEIPNSVLTTSFNHGQGAYLQVISSDRDWRSNDCGFSIGSEDI